METFVPTRTQFQTQHIHHLTGHHGNQGEPSCQHRQRNHSACLQNTNCRKIIPISNIGNNRNFYFDDRTYSSTMAVEELYKYLLKRYAETSAHLQPRFNTECFSGNDVTGKYPKNQWPHRFPSNTTSTYYETRDICRLTAIATYFWAQFPATPLNHPKPSTIPTIRTFYSMAQRPNAGHGLLILEVSRSHTTTHHSR